MKSHLHLSTKNLHHLLFTINLPQLISTKKLHQIREKKLPLPIPDGVETEIQTTRANLAHGCKGLNPNSHLCPGQLHEMNRKVVRVTTRIVVIKIIEDTEIIIGIIEIMIGEVEAEIVAEMVATTIIIGEITIGEIVETTQDENEATEIEVVIGEFNLIYLIIYFKTIFVLRFHHF